MSDKETTWDKLLQIKTTGRDDSNSDQYRYPYDCSLTSLSLLSLRSHQIVAFRNHSFNLFLRHRSVQNHRIPVFLVLMIARLHRRVSIPPKLSPLRAYLHVNAKSPVSLIGPEKHFFVLFQFNHFQVLFVIFCYSIV